MPKAPRRAADLDINVVEDGYIIYDARQDIVVYLNPTSAAVLELCDGFRELSTIATDLGRLFETGPQEYLAQQAIAELIRAGLVQ